MLIVSQFTLLGDCRKGRRPSFIAAADPALGERLTIHSSRRLPAAAFRRYRQFRQHMDWRS